MHHSTFSIYFNVQNPAFNQQQGKYKASVTLLSTFFHLFKVENVAPVNANNSFLTEETYLLTSYPFDNQSSVTWKDATNMHQSELIQTIGAAIHQYLQERDQDFAACFN